MISATAQYQLYGTVKDRADNAPIAFATVALLRSDSTAITAAMTGEEGTFIIPNVAASDYLLQVSLIGYEKTYHRVNVPAQSDLGNIFLKAVYQ